MFLTKFLLTAIHCTAVLSTARVICARAFYLAAALMLSAALPAQAASFAHCPQQRQVKAAVLLPGDIWHFTEMFNLTLNELRERGLTLSGRKEPLPLQFPAFEAEGYSELARDSRTDCLALSDSGLYNAQWDRAAMIDGTQELLERAGRGDIDLIIALGTTTGMKLSSAPLPVPVVLLKARTPETSGISKASDLSDNGRLHVLKEPKRVTYELNLYYETFRFKHLGVVLDHDRDLQLGQGLGLLQEIAENRGFELELCYGEIFTSDKHKARAEYARCLADLSGRADAVYLTEFPGMNSDDYYSKLKPLLDAGIPTFSQTGGREVQQGALLSLASNENETLAVCEADVIERILQGEDLRNIPQYCHTTQRLFLNLKTARTIGWRPPFSILTAVDVVYHNFSGAHQRSTQSSPLN